MTWVEIFAVFVVAHLVGDFALQTEWQAVHKAGGLGRDGTARRALCAHLATYALPFVPALAWAGRGLTIAQLLGLLVVLLAPHLIQDDRRLLEVYVRRMKGADPEASPVLMLALDQTFHVTALFAAALIAA